MPVTWYVTVVTCYVGRFFFISKKIIYYFMFFFFLLKSTEWSCVVLIFAGCPAVLY
jgi:hypothetical protein